MRHNLPFWNEEQDLLLWFRNGDAVAYLPTHEPVDTQNMGNERWDTIYLENVIVAQCDKRFPIFNGTLPC
jgi:hypothetical protein